MRNHGLLQMQQVSQQISAGHWIFGAGNGSSKILCKTKARAEDNAGEWDFFTVLPILTFVLTQVRRELMLIVWQRALSGKNSFDGSVDIRWD